MSTHNTVRNSRVTVFAMYISILSCYYYYRLASNGKDPDDTGSDVTYQMGIITTPNLGHYEATLVYSGKEDRFHIREKDISRTNAYGKQPHCVSVKQPRLQKYCYCREQINWNKWTRVDCQEIYVVSSAQNTPSLFARLEQTKPDRMSVFRVLHNFMRLHLLLSVILLGYRYRNRFMTKGRCAIDLYQTKL